MYYFCKYEKTGKVSHFTSEQDREDFMNRFGGTYYLWTQTDNMTQEEYDKQKTTTHIVH